MIVLEKTILHNLSPGSLNILNLGAIWLVLSHLNDKHFVTLYWKDTFSQFALSFFVIIHNTDLCEDSDHVNGVLNNSQQLSCILILTI